jgi:hypothetical protein
MMRSRAISIVTMLVSMTGCARSAPARAGQSVSRLAAMDTGVVRRLCADADSVIAGRRACVLSDQGVRPRLREVVKP